MERKIRREAGERVLKLPKRFISKLKLKKLYADGTYISEKFGKWVKKEFGAVVETAQNLALKAKKFIPVSQRWVVERSLSWLYDNRRLTID